MSTFGHGIALQQKLVDLLRADAFLSDPTTGLLYPAWAPKLDANDLRVYEINLQMPGNSLAVRTLPRVLIESIQMSHNFEQDSDVLQGPVKVWVHSVVPREYDQLGATIDGYITTRLLSTWLSDTRIIAAKLAMDGAQRRERITEFNGAYQYVTGFASANVGSLQ